jgi:hypothetical protein
MQPGNAVKGTWLVACLWLAATACAAQRSASVSAPPPPVAGTSNDPHQQIQELAQQIDAESTQLGLVHDLGIAQDGNTKETPFAVRQCTPGPSAVCQDVCRLDDSICSNAKKICDLSDQLPNDDWARHQCHNAQTACEASHDKCCGCQS